MRCAELVFTVRSSKNNRGIQLDPFSDILFYRLYDLEKHVVKWEAETHKGGVYGYDLCRTFNFLATCGLERNIHLWNPFTGTVSDSTTSPLLGCRV